MKLRSYLLVCALLLGCTATVAQTPQPAPAGSKKNARPQGATKPVDRETRKPAPSVQENPSYVYEFKRDEFIVSFIRIEHDEQGRGRILFQKVGLERPESDPLTLSPVTLEKIKSAFAALNFLDSTESYQYEKEYLHLGAISITHRKGDRERTARFNWTVHPEAKVLMDEYRKIGNQYVWQFDMEVARANQPLNAPSLMDVLDSYIRRGEISDLTQMLPLLKELTNDARIPLIARNHAAKLVTQFETKKN